jgi:hypothetical protein
MMGIANYHVNSHHQKTISLSKLQAAKICPGRQSLNNLGLENQEFQRS